MATFKGCFTVGEVLDAPGGRTVGKLVEAPIYLDYLSETHGTALATVFQPETDWWDDGRRDDYIDILLKRHKHLDRATLQADARVKSRLRQPDILSFDGWRFTIPGMLGTLPGMSGKLKVPKIPSPGIDVRGRHEFYEIKPNSATGIKQGDDKIADLIKTYKDYKLPYKRGDFYPLDNPKELPLLGNLVFRYLRKILLLRYDLSGVRMFIELSRPKRGLLLYKLCIEIRARKSLSQEQADFAARVFYEAYVSTHAPASEVEALLKATGPGTGASRPRVPTITAEFPEIADEIGHLKQSIVDVLFSRCVGLPGQEYLICCDEAYYKQAVKQTAAVARTIGMLQVQLTPATTGFAADRSRWVFAKPVVVRAIEAVQLLRGLESSALQAAKQALFDLDDWSRQHPYAAVALLAVGVVLTAAAIVLLFPELLAASVGTLGATTLAEVEATGATLATGTRVATAASPYFQAVMTESIMGDAVGTSIAQQAGARQIIIDLAAEGSKRAVPELLKQIGASATAGVESGALQGFLGNSATLRTAIGAGAGLTVALVGHSAYAQSGDAPAGNTAPTSQSVDLSKPLATVYSRLFLVPANVTHIGGEPQQMLPPGAKKPPALYTEIDARKYGLVLPLSSTPLNCRYLGRVRLS